MFKRRSDEELWRLQQELLAAEEEDCEEEYEDEYEDEYEYEDDSCGDEPDLETLLEELDEEDAEYSYHDSVSRYRRGSQKRFDSRELFEEDDFPEGEVVYKKDYRKARRKKRRQNFALLILAILEIVCIAAIIAWWIAWTR